MLASPSDDIYKLFAKCRSGQASKEEERRLNDFAQASAENKLLIEQLDQVWSTDLAVNKDDELISQSEVRDQVWDAVFDKSKKKGNSSWDLSRYLKVAAVVALVCITPALLYMTFDFETEEVPAVTTITKQTLPGQRMTITMRDGSVVWLNSGSKISYSSDFNDSVRLIELEGQAYFEVFKDRTKPFVVRCQGLDVQALGTSFDINGYENGPVQVSLVTGKVLVSAPFESELREHILEPGQFSLVDIENQVVQKGNFNEYEVLAWKEGRLYFKNATIAEIVPKLELWYGVQINNQHLVDPTRPFTTTFERENLENVLTNIKEVLDFEFDIEGNIITIKKKLPM